MNKILGIDYLYDDYNKTQYEKCLGILCLLSKGTFGRLFKKNKSFNNNMYFLKQIFYSLFLGGCYYAIDSILLRIIRYFFFPTYAIRPFAIFTHGFIFLLIFLILSLVLSWRIELRKNTFEPHANYTLIYLFCNLFLIVTILIDGLAGYTDLILLSLCTTIPITVISYFVERKFVRAGYTEK